MADIICLSSDEETIEPPPKKRAILHPVLEIIPIENNVIIDVDAPFKIVKPGSSIICEDAPVCDRSESISPKEDSNSAKGSSDAGCSITSNTNDKKKTKKRKSPTTTMSVSNRVEFEILEFFRNCIPLVAVKNQDLVRSKIPYIKKLLTSLGEEIVEEEMDDPINKYSKLLRDKPDDALKWFTEMYEVLKFRYQNKLFEPNENKDRKPGETQMIIELRQTLSKLQRKIRSLEMAEVNFDEEEDSTYIKLCRYKERACQVHKTLCELNNKKSNCSRIIYKRLDFVTSKYREINNAINKVYKDNSVFPTFYEFNKLIRSCVTKHSLDIPERVLRIEITNCFEKFGTLLQNRRRIDLLDIHSSYIDHHPPLDETDTELSMKLEASKRESDSKMEAILQKYTLMQENGETKDVSCESDDSDLPQSDSDVEITT